ncbi:sulfurtransferase [Sphingobacterium sp. LRF_L2]|uniref:sulfurtransferase n=1 Tax=Sphingobacterium sp. LRF_L2 TaxID=3369421 RepID=UPI003F62DB2A
MNVLITTAELFSLKNTVDYILIDATSGNDAYGRYQQEHLQGALFVDLEKDLSAVDDPKHGGRHPLISPKSFSNLLSKLGISKNSQVIVYDRANGANAAARFWWMLRAAGHLNVQVLDGGFQAAKKNGFPTNTGIEVSTKTAAFSFEEWQLPLIDINGVADLIHDPSAIIIDVREAFRYKGESEPIDLLAGHIPTAINIPLAQNLEENGYFKTPEELQKLYSPYFLNKDPEKSVVHCGSGVTACHTLLALAHAGFDIPRLYVGSWSEWSRNLGENKN